MELRAALGESLGEMPGRARAQAEGACTRRLDEVKSLMNKTLMNKTLMKQELEARILRKRRA
jgi:hypothetical protein